MSKKAIWLIIAAVVIVALVWLGLSRMRANNTVVSSENVEVVEEVVEVEAPVALDGEVPAPAAE